MKKKLIVIKCPHCGYEYLPSEIYYANDFLGSPKNIIKDDDGTITYFGGESMNLEEEYVCDNCDHKFKIVANVSFDAEEVKEEDNWEDSSTTII